MSLSRRTLLQSGIAGVLGLSLPELLATEALAASGKRRQAKNVLVVLEQGGMSHIDTWDPKPEAAVDHRSPYKPIATNVPGIQFTSLLSKTARIADKLAVVRSMYHDKPGANGHPQGTQYALSGAHPNNPTEMPDLGSLVAHLIGSRCKYLPPYVMLPGNSEQAKESRSGFLPESMSAFKTGGKDLSDKDWRVTGLLPREENSGGRLDARRQLLNRMDQSFYAGGHAAVGMQGFYEQAFNTLTSSRVADTFSVRGEPAEVRERYGKGHRGACYLVGRKLIEAGVRFVTVDVRWPHSKQLPQGTNLNWDHHDFIYAEGTCNLPGAGGGGRGRRGIGTWEMMGSTDQAFAALIQDLDERGLLADTLVCFITEFGRTPKLNKAQGRDHWTRGYSIVFAGAGVPGGQVIGATDPDGGDAVNHVHTPEDYGTTVLAKLGIDLTRPIFTPGGRPIFLNHHGHPIPELF